MLTTAADRAAKRFQEVIGTARRDCPLCGSLHLQYQFLVNNFPLCACQSCGLAFLNPAPQIGVAQENSSETYKYAHPRERIAELKRYAGILGGSLLLIADDDALAPLAVEQGFETHFVAVDDLAAIDRVACQFDACVIYCALAKSDSPLLLLQLVRRAVTDNAALMVVAPLFGNSPSLHRSRKLNTADRFYFTADTLQTLALEAGFGDPIFAPAVRLAGNGASNSATPTLTTALFRAKPCRNAKLLSVIVPVYNERNTFPLMMDDLLKKTVDGLEIEIIVVESNSTDGSRELVLRYADHPRVTVILEPKPKGKGHAMRAGLQAARGDIILFQDADLEYDLNDYDALLAPILKLEANFVLGSRHNASNTVWKIRRFTDSAALAAYFNLGHVLFLALFNLVYGQRLTDPFTMYKVFRRECIYGLEFECNRFDFDNEIVIKLLRKGYRALELPVNYVSRSFEEGKKVTLVGDAFRWLRTLFKFRRTPLYPSFHS